MSYTDHSMQRRLKSNAPHISAVNRLIASNIKLFIYIIYVCAVYIYYVNINIKHMHVYI